MGERFSPAEGPAKCARSCIGLISGFPHGINAMIGSGVEDAKLRQSQCRLFTRTGLAHGGITTGKKADLARPSTNGRVRPKSVIRLSHSQWPLADRKAAVRITLLKPPVLPHSGSRRFVLTNLKCKSEIRIVVRDLLTFEGREVRSGEALSFPRNIG